MERAKGGEPAAFRALADDPSDRIRMRSTMALIDGFPTISAAKAVPVGLVLFEDTSAQHDLLTLGLLGLLDTGKAIFDIHTGVLFALGADVFSRRHTLTSSTVDAQRRRPSLRERLCRQCPEDAGSTDLEPLGDLGCPEPLVSKFPDIAGADRDRSSLADIATQLGYFDSSAPSCTDKVLLHHPDHPEQRQHHLGHDVAAVENDFGIVDLEDRAASTIRFAIVSRSPVSLAILSG